MPPNTSTWPKHLAAIFPYFNIYQQPAIPASRKITGAVYLFRHGIIEVSGHDYYAFIAPFLKKLTALQQTSRKSNKAFVAAPLKFLETYLSWIMEAHVGTMAEPGLVQSKELGKAFRVRYKNWLGKRGKGPRGPSLKIWADVAARCHYSAEAFGEGFSGGMAPSQILLTLPGETSPLDGLQPVTPLVHILDPKADPHNPANNLAWRTTFPEVDQTAGQVQMDTLMAVTTHRSLTSLQSSWLSTPLEPRDVYAMQMLHCYDLVSGRASPWTELFTDEDWEGFEYLRDVKYHYSEGHGAKYSGVFATPWLVATLEVLAKLHDSTVARDNDAANGDNNNSDLPLRIAFTHREEILYLCVLLGLGTSPASSGPWKPDLTKIDNDRPWRVSHMAPYLGHVGIETFVSHDGVDEKNKCRVRVIVNGEVLRGVFGGEIEADGDGGTV